jgi:hypothetical protein
MDAYPHGAEEYDGPLTLLIGHGDVMAGAVLLLEVTPFFGEFTAEEMVPSDCFLLFE